MFTRPLFQTPDMQRQHELLNEVASLATFSQQRSREAQVCPMTVSPVLNEVGFFGHSRLRPNQGDCFLSNGRRR
jgi:hypothetical protein